jgi:hypothetical protein
VQSDLLSDRMTTSCRIIQLSSDKQISLAGRKSSSIRPHQCTWIDLFRCHRKTRDAQSVAASGSRVVHRPNLVTDPSYRYTSDHSKPRVHTSRHRIYMPSVGTTNVSHALLSHCKCRVIRAAGIDHQWRDRQLFGTRGQRSLSDLSHRNSSLYVQ